jgi:hypothetical protein
MKIIEDIKRYFYKSTISQRAEGLKAVRKITNLEDAKTIGIIYDSSNPNHDVSVTKFSETLRGKGKTVEILGFLKDKKIDHKEDILIFNLNSINWYGIPNSPRVDDFCKKEFDLLLCLFTEEVLPLEYVAFFSKAKYRVGVFDTAKTAYYDLMIKAGEQKDMNYLIQQIVHFLNNIKYA